MYADMRAIRAVIAAMLLTVATALPAQAADEEWQFEVTPYFWAAGIDAKVQVENQSIDVDESFSDIWNALDMAALVLMRAERNNWVWWAQADYFALSGDEKDESPANGRLEADVTMLTAGFGRQFESSDGSRAIDVLIGPRYLSTKSKLRLDVLGTFHSKRSFTDPVVILRPSFRISERWRLNPTFSFGAGGDSESTWELQPQVQFQMTERMALRFGYRKLHYHVESSNGNEFKGAFEGPLIGIGGTFGGSGN